MQDEDREDEVAKLFRLAGQRPRLPEAEVEPIRAAAREVFRRQARRSAAARRLAWGMGAGLAAGLLVAVGFFVRRPEAPGAAPDEGNPVGRFEISVGEVELTDAAGRKAGPGPLLAGTVVTTGASGRAAVRLPGGSSLRIDVGSAVHFDSSRRVSLERGALYVDSGPAASEVEIATAFGLVRDVGTQFETRLLAQDPAALRVRVREGRVLVDREGKIHEAGAGGELVLRADGNLRRAAIPAHAPGWDWTQSVVPPLDIEGVTLEEFLDWASREMGVPWQLAAPGGKPPREIILHGSIAGLTAQKALAVVLRGTGYRYRRDGDQLWIVLDER